jgi:hypothetical protein
MSEQVNVLLKVFSVLLLFGLFIILPGHWSFFLCQFRKENSSRHDLQHSRWRRDGQEA